MEQTRKQIQTYRWTDNHTTPLSREWCGRKAIIHTNNDNGWAFGESSPLPIMIRIGEAAATQRVRSQYAGQRILNLHRKFPSNSPLEYYRLAINRQRSAFDGPFMRASPINYVDNTLKEKRINTSPIILALFECLTGYRSNVYK